MSQPVANPLPRRIALPLLLLILLAGLALRTWNLNFDQGIGSHPDERSTSCFYAPGIHLPASWEEFSDPQRSPLNPLWDRTQQQRRSFTYGHFPLYLGVATGHLLAELAPAATWLGAPETTAALMARADHACDAIAVAGRLLMALLDTLTILLLYLIGARVFGRGAGLLAAAFYAFSAQAVQLSHFFAMDPASTTFTVLAILGAILMLQTRSVAAALLAGLGVGLAISSKFSALPILLAPITAGALILWADYQRRRQSGVPADGRAQFAALIGVPVALLTAVLSFAITSPYAVLDWQSFIQATLVEQGRMVRGVADMPFTRQYRNTTPYLYFIEQQIRWGLGWPLGLVSLAGAVYMAIRGGVSVLRIAWLIIRRPASGAATRWLSDLDMANLLLWSWVLPYFALTGAFLAKFNRYMIPLLPFTALFAAILIGELWRRGAQAKLVPSESEDDEDEFARPVSFWRRLARPVAVVLATVGLVGGIFWSTAYVNGVYGSEHSWITASRWIYENVPRESVILWELWDDPLPKAIPNEPGMDMGTAGLRNIDWSPYEEDTADKYALLKEKLRAADYVAYSSKRIYDSVDELPERYPMTTLYYESMWDGSLGFELAYDGTSPPSLLGMTFEDRRADESWSLYDHPQVTVFRKVSDLGDAEYDDLFDRAWADATPYYRGADSPLSPLLNLIGLGNAPESEQRGLINGLIAIFAGQNAAAPASPEPEGALLLDEPLRALPVVDDYRWNDWASQRPAAAALWWWFVVTLLGLLVWPLCFLLFRPLRDRGFLLSRAVGWLLPGWLLWLLASYRVTMNSTLGAWLAVVAVAVVSVVAAFRQRAAMQRFLAERWGLLLAGEALFALAYAGFILIRMGNPDLWQPWLGGEKFMEFAFLNGILRSPHFPPVDPHFAGGFINYYYFGIYLVAYLIKLTGIYAEVAFNLVIPTLFALTAVNAFAVAYSAIRSSNGAANQDRLPWRRGFGAALLAPLFVLLLGNLDGFAQLLRSMANYGALRLETAFTGVRTLASAAVGVGQIVAGNQSLPRYDFWAPSRVIPNTINEFPFWSFLFADLHPHLIGIPFSVLFLALLLTLLKLPEDELRRGWGYRLFLLAAFGLMLGTLASVNLWELPTYFGLGLLAFAMAQFRAWGRIRWAATAFLAVGYLALAYLFFLPFFANYTNIGASGVGFVREADSPGTWLLIWGLLGFVLLSWLVYVAMRLPRRWRKDEKPLVPSQDAPPDAENEVALSDVDPSPVVSDVQFDATPDDDPEPDSMPRDGELPANEVPTMQLPATEPVGETILPTGVERWLSLILRRFERLPRAFYLHGRLVQHPTATYLSAQALFWLVLIAAALAMLAGRTVLAFCLAPLSLAILLLWRRGRSADAGSAFSMLLTATGLAILAGTQVIFLKDFLQGGDWYRMNTLFKFFSQTWVIWGVAAAIALPRFWSGVIRPAQRPALTETGSHGSRGAARVSARLAWAIALALLLISSLAFPLLGTPARLSARLDGWRPPFGTLDGMDYMRLGTYSWPDGSNVFELRHDWDALRWLLDNVRGNLVIAESSEVDYYRAGGTRAATFTGLSGLRGMHESEQRYGGQLGERSALHGEFWMTPDVGRTLELIDQLDIALIYVGQLERHQHPAGVEKLARMAADGQLTVVYENEGVTIYAAPDALVQHESGGYGPG